MCAPSGTPAETAVALISSAAWLRPLLLVQVVKSVVLSWATCSQPTLLTLGVTPGLRLYFQSIELEPAVAGFAMVGVNQ